MSTRASRRIIPLTDWTVILMLILVGFLGIGWIKRGAGIDVYACGGSGNDGCFEGQGGCVPDCEPPDPPGPPDEPPGPPDEPPQPPPPDDDTTPPPPPPPDDDDDDDDDTGGVTIQKTTGGNCPASVPPGANSVFTLGFGSADRAAIFDNLPAAFDYVSSFPSGVYSSEIHTILWSNRNGNGLISVSFHVKDNAAPGTVTNRVSITNQDGSTASASCLINIGSSGIVIKGDIRAGGQIARVTVSGPSVVAAGGSINVTADGAIFPIQNYLALRPEWRTSIDANISRLVAERARNYTGGTLSGGYSINPNNRIDGEVWRRNGNLTISGNTTITGRGTIIVDGNLIINGNITYGNQTSQVGFIVRGGNVTFGATPTTVNGAFYVPDGAANFSASGTALSLSGQIISNSFSFASRNITISHDTRLTLLPPPGFVSILFPAFKEVAP